MEGKKKLRGHFKGYARIFSSPSFERGLEVVANPSLSFTVD